MVVKVSGESYVQSLMTKSATSPPRGTVWHNRKRPLGRPGPGSKDQRLRKELRGMSFWSYNCNIVVWGCNFMLGAEGEGYFITHSIWVYA